MKKIFTIVFMYIAAIIGAGFATGSEIVYYFIRFGNFSFVGIMLTSFGFGIVSYSVLMLCKSKNTKNFDGFIYEILGRKKFLANIIIYIFSMVLLGAMIRAFADIMESLFPLSKRYFALLFAFLCFFIMLLPDKIFTRLGSMLGIIIVLFITLCSLYMLKNRHINVFSNNARIIASSVTYTAYNTIAVIPLLCGMIIPQNNDNKNKNIN